MACGVDKYIFLRSQFMWDVCCLGERALRSVLEDGMKIAEKCTNPDDREAIVKAVGDIQSMVDALAELRAQGKVCLGVR